jgi:membrane protease YdiL (CAAX protease family)
MPCLRSCTFASRPRQSWCKTTRPIPCFAEPSSQSASAERTEREAHDTTESGNHTTSKNLDEPPSIALPSGLQVQPQNDSTHLETLDFFKTSVYLITLQIVCGYGLTPALASLAADLPILGVSLAPFLGQLTLIYCSGFIIRPALQRGGFTDQYGFFRYTAKPSMFAIGLALTILSLAVAFFLDNLEAAKEPSSTSVDLITLLNGGSPLSMYFTGMTTGALTPWIEERIYRGFILQGLLPYVGIPGAVCTLCIASTRRSMICLCRLLAI